MTLQPGGPAWLFCPADRPDRFGKAAAVADVVILDLEDGVAAADKDAARAALLDTPLDPARTVVRINAPTTADYRADLETVAQTTYTTVMLPKCESAQQISALAPWRVIVLIETPLGAVNVAESVRATNTYGVMWGSEDLFAALGGTANRRPDGTLRDVASHVRSATLLAAKAHSRLALDSVYLDIKDLQGLHEEVEDAVAVGFDAKVAIHPSQIPVIRAAYAPAADQVDWARRVLAAARDQRGVFELDGKMVDMPVLRRAGHILRLSGTSDGAVVP
ncbi:MAG: citE [Mycobacterium sp.]|jgi:citrate lyase subunit beta/citryl-CoA lyase|nr:citE [Mycobacterium sp.]